MRRWDLARFVAAGVLVLAIGCTCEGKSEPAASVEERPPQKRDSPPPAKEGRFNKDRDGFVKARLGDKTVEFKVLPPTQNRVALETKPSFVVVDAYAAAGGEEHMRVHMQGVDFLKLKGRPLTPRRDVKGWAVAVVYEDGAGKRWFGMLGGDPGRPNRLEMKLGEVDLAKQTVSGTFTGTLKDADSDALLEVTGGAFRTGLVPAG